MARVKPPPISFAPIPGEFLRSRTGAGITVLSGLNNSGKTYFLKHIRKLLGADALIVGVDRFSTAHELQTHNPDERQLQNSYESFLTSFDRGDTNADKYGFSIPDLMRHLPNKQRDRVFQICGTLLGGTMSLKHVDNENDMTPYYVDLDGVNINFGSSGTRLLIILLCHLFDPRFHHIIIDEPELGLNPRVQAALGRWLTSPDLLTTELPNLSTLFISTHSHFFLDRNCLSNNFVVTKEGTNVSITAVRDHAGLNHLQFGMLGSDLTSLYLPSAIILVEGPSDYTFLSRIVSLRLPDHKIAIVNCRNDDGIKQRLHWLSETFPHLERGPYYRRTWAILDGTTDVNDAALSKKGVLPTNVKKWTQNGIEHYYPQGILKSIFCCNDSELSAMTLGSSTVTIGGTTKQKTAVASEVANLLTRETVFDEELEDFLRELTSRLTE